MAARNFSLQRRSMLALLASAPFAASSQPRMASKVGRNALRLLSEAAARELWPGHTADVFHVRAPEGRAQFFSEHKEQPTKGAFNDLVEMMRPAETREHHLVVFGANPRLTARTILSVMLYSDLKAPLKLHLAFVGRRDYGEALRPQIAPALLEFLIVDPDDDTGK